MTDARFPERYLSDRRVRRLGPVEAAGWAFATIWSVSNRTDGAIAVDDLPLIPLMAPAIAAKLEASGLWVKAHDGWQIVDFERDQTSRSDLEVLERARKADRDKKARQRAQKKESPGPSPGHVPGTAQDRTGQAGQDRPGQAEVLTAVPDEKPVNAVATWPVVQIPVAPDPRCVVCDAQLPAGSTADYCEASDDAQHAEYERLHVAI